MSYCRWSCMDWQCDLYIYESNAGIEIHVANNRIVYTEELPVEPPWIKENIPAILERRAVVDAIRERSDRKDIGLPHDGESWTLDIEDAVPHLIMLRELGYQFPDYVIETLEEEMQEEQNEHCR